MPFSLPKELLVKIGGSVAGLQRAGQESQAIIGRVGREAKDVTRTIGATLATAAGLGYATKRLFLDPFAEQEDALASLNQALVSTGKVGSEALAKIADEASRLQRITRFGDDELVKASATLATLAPALQADELVRAERALVGIADTFTDGNLDSAASLLGKTLGSTTNALGRYGIQIDTAGTASEKLAEILGNRSLGAAFDVAQAKAQTFGGRMEQIQNAIGDIRETIGGIIVRMLDLTGGAGSIAERLLDLNARIDANQAKWVAWGQVGIRAVEFVAKTLQGLVRIAFNVGQLIGRAMDIAANLMIGAFFKASEIIKVDWADLANAAQRIFDPLNLIPDIVFEHDATRSEAFFASAKEQAEAFNGDLADIGDAVRDIADAWLGVQAAAEGARQASGRVGQNLPSVPSGQPTFDDLFNAAGGIDFRMPRSHIRGLPGLEHLPKEGTEAYRRMFRTRAQIEREEDTINGIYMPRIRAKTELPPDKEDDGLEKYLSDSKDVVVGTFQKMADAAVSESARMSDAIISSIQAVVARIKTRDGGLFGDTLTGGLLGVGLGVVGALIAKRADRPQPVHVASYSREAIDQMNRSERPMRLTVINEQGGQSIERLEYEFYDRQNRDEVVRTFRGRGYALQR